jgi:hypothetical protein
MDVPDDLRITIRDVRLAGHCARGARDWFERYGFDFHAVLGDGVPGRDMIATGDEQGIRVVMLKLERESR